MQILSGCRRADDTVAKNAGTEPFGRWLLDVRQKLAARQSVDLRGAPAEVSWIELDGTEEDRRRQIEAGGIQPPDRDGSVIIIGDSRSPRASEHLQVRSRGQ